MVSRVSVSWTNYNIWFAIITPSSVCFNERLSAGHLCCSVTIYQELPRISSVFLLPPNVRRWSCNSQICPQCPHHTSWPHVSTDVSTHTVQWHVVISDTGAPAAAEAGITMAGCRSPVICYLLSANALYSIYNLHNSINTTSHHTSLGGPGHRVLDLSPTS